MGQGKLGRGTQQHKKATPHSSPCQNELRVGRNFCIYDTWYVPALSSHTRTNAKNRLFFLFFYLMLVYLRGLGITEIRDLFFRGPIWMRLKNSGSFCVGQVPGTSYVATRPKHTCERRVCPSLSRPFAAAPASSLFVVVQSVLDVTRKSVATVVASPVSPHYFLFFLSAGSLKKNTRYSSKQYCLLLLAVFLL